MGTLNDDLNQALLFMPEHRSRNKRSRTLHLDMLLEDFRKQQEITPSGLDLILMGYRYSGLFERSLKEFSDNNKFSPPELKDLWQIIFAALLTRDNTPGSALVDTGVEVARNLYGERTTRITNAYLRRTVREKISWQARLKDNPSLVLSAELNQRWQHRPDLLNRTGKQLGERPEAGLTAFSDDGELRRVKIQEISGVDRIQAMDPGSWQFSKWAADAIRPLGANLKILDACAAPGGKLIALNTLLKNQTPQFTATEPKFSRLEILRENLRRWNLSESVEVKHQGWGEGAGLSTSFDAPTAGSQPDGVFDVVLADLPCSGSGTFHSRPDLLSMRTFPSIPELAKVQNAILADLKKQVRPGGLLFVSVCSVDPEEIASLTLAIGSPPNFESWKQDPATIEGITAWSL